MTARLGIALLLAASLAGCVRAGSTRKAKPTTGTCEGACRHYMACKRLENNEVMQACVLECREIFIEEGVADTDTLRDFERLECDATVAYVEGKSGRPPGVEPAVDTAHGPSP